jgi:hypothetical protein
MRQRGNRSPSAVVCALGQKLTLSASILGSMADIDVLTSTPSETPILASIVEGFDLNRQAVAYVAGLDAAMPQCTFQLALSDEKAGEAQLVQRGFGRDHQSEDRW